jgi:hypothetical protein
MPPAAHTRSRRAGRARAVASESAEAGDGLTRRRGAVGPGRARHRPARGAGAVGSRRARLRARRSGGGVHAAVARRRSLERRRRRGRALLAGRRRGRGAGARGARPEVRVRRVFAAVAVLAEGGAARRVCRRVPPAADHAGGAGAGAGALEAQLRAGSGLRAATEGAHGAGARRQQAHLGAVGAAVARERVAQPARRAEGPRRVRGLARGPRRAEASGGALELDRRSGRAAVASLAGLGGAHWKTRCRAVGAGRAGGGARRRGAGRAEAADGADRGRRRSRGGVRPAQALRVVARDGRADAARGARQVAGGPGRGSSSHLGVKALHRYL